jgi:hypothetical protein
VCHAKPWTGACLRRLKHLDAEARSSDEDPRVASIALAVRIEANGSAELLDEVVAWLFDAASGVAGRPMTEEVFEEDRKLREQLPNREEFEQGPEEHIEYWTEWWEEKKNPTPLPPPPDLEDTQWSSPGSSDGS